MPVCYDRTRVALYQGGFADVWKGKHCGRDVAVKALRTYSNSDLQKIIGVGCRLFLLIPHVSMLTRPWTEVLQGGRDVENPSAPERPSTNRGDYD